LDTLVNIYPTIVVCCVALAVLSAVIACVTAWCLFKPDALDKSERDVEIDKQMADLKTALRRKNRLDRRMSQKCQRLELRIKKLEKLNREKTDETPIRNPRSSSYDAGLDRRKRD
jgi:hypothetical protein